MDMAIEGAAIGRPFAQADVTAFLCRSSSFGIAAAIFSAAVAAFP
jgi:hypothetical protein